MKKSLLRCCGLFIANNPKFQVRALAVLLALSGFLVSQSVEAQTQTPAPVKTVPAFDNSFSIIPMTLPDNQWGYMIKKSGQTVFVSHDRSKEGWKNTPTFISKDEALKAGEKKKAELEKSSAAQPKITDQKK